MKDMEAMVSVVVSASSDIGSALCVDWARSGEDVIGTYRSSDSIDGLQALGVNLFRCDLSSRESLAEWVGEMPALFTARSWDKLVLSAGTQNPVGLFGQTDFGLWRDSIEVNFLAQVEILQALLPFARPGARVMFFAGGGTNSAVPRYSAYTISKIASIKLCELLAAEYPELTFFSLGPGWVRTKIHQETLDAGTDAGKNWSTTRDALAGQSMFPMNKLVETVNHLMGLGASAVSGRNFSAVHDPIRDESFLRELESDSDLYKLRRHGNFRGRAVPHVKLPA